MKSLSLPLPRVLLCFLFASLLHGLGATVRIHEFMASNGSTIADEDGDFEDWIELHNTGAETVSLAGWGLSDSVGSPFKWIFPEGIVIEPGDYLLVWASGKDRLPTSPGEPHIHTNFRISAAGEDLLLTRPDGTLADFVAAVPVPRDLSYGRRPDDPSVWAYFYEPTPGAANTTPAFAELITPVTLSHAAGFYSAPFNLQLAHPDPEVTVIYTLDGSEPDIDNFSGRSYPYLNSYPRGPFLQNTYTTAVYEGPITVADRSAQPDKLARIATTSASTPNHFPSSPVKKGTVVRARAYRDGAAGPITTATYFISPTNAFAYGVPILSLSLDEDGLFDFLDGIYVAGVDRVTQSGGRICDWGNYNRRGREAERAAHIEFFNADGRFLDQAGGLRLQGNCSRMLAQKSLRLYARSVDAEDSIFDFPFFHEPVFGSVNPDNPVHDRLILRTANFHDTAFSRLFHGVYEGVAGRILPVKHFINGEYWGLGLLRDRFDPPFLANNYDLDPDNITLIDISYRHEYEPISFSFNDRIYTLSSGIPEDLTDFAEMMDFVSKGNMADPAVYAAAAERICISSFIDHLILKIFAGDDHYAPEIIYWRARLPENGGFGDGRWRFFVKDFDSTLFTSNYLQGLATGTHPRPFGYELFASLLRNPAFRTRFINRFADLLNTHFRTDRFEEIILQTFAEIAPLWPEATARWNNTSLSNPNRPFTAGVRDNLLRWAREHPARQRAHIRSHFLIGQERALTIDVADPAKGSVRVNTINIDSSTPKIATQSYPWTGLYFPAHPVQLRALPADGFRLSEWRVTPTGGGATVVHTGNPLSLNPTQAFTVEAVFAELPPPPPDFLEMVAGADLALDLREWFPEAPTAATFSAQSSDETVLTATLFEDTLTLTALRAGETNLTVLGGGSSHTARILIYGAPFPLADNAYTFDYWSPDEPAGRYPANMLFTQSDATDPGLGTPSLFAYHIPPEDAADAADALFPYRASSRTRINGLGSGGIRFINTGRGRDLGAAVLTLDTTGAQDMRVAWTAGTDLPNSRVYALRLQYRLDLGEPWMDAPDENGDPLVYARQVVAGHSQRFGPLRLPAHAHEQPRLQLRWLYHHIAGTSGPRAALRLDDIVVAAGPARSFPDWLLMEFPDPLLRTDPAFASPDADPTGSGLPNLLRYALGLGWDEAPATNLPRIDFVEDGKGLRFFRHPERPDVTYQIESSPDLQTWGEPIFDSRLDPLPDPAHGWMIVPFEITPPQFFRLRLILEER